MIPDLLFVPVVLVCTSFRVNYTHENSILRKALTTLRHVGMERKKSGTPPKVVQTAGRGVNRGIFKVVHRRSERFESSTSCYVWEN